jgi:putative phage-type endonuclease
MNATPDFLVTRRSGIGGSDAGAILGLSPWKTPLDVWLEKTGQADSMEDTAATYWGRKLEDLVADEYVARTGRKVERCNDTLRHPERFYMLGHVDRLIWDGDRRPRVRGEIRTRRILECKTAGAFMAPEWGEAGTDQIPEAYLCQVQHYLAVTGCEVADVAVLIGGRDFRLYEIPRDNELIRLLEDAEAQFWALVMENVPPAPRSLADIAKRWPRDSGGQVMASQEVEQMVFELRAMKDHAKDLDARIEACEGEIKKALMDAAELITPDGRKLATWKTQTSKRVELSRLKTERPEIAAEFTTESTTRVFRLASPKAALKEAA